MDATAECLMLDAGSCSQDTPETPKQPPSSHSATEQPPSITAIRSITTKTAHSPRHQRPLVPLLEFIHSNRGIPQQKLPGPQLKPGAGPGRALKEFCRGLAGLEDACLLLARGLADVLQFCMIGVLQEVLIMPCVQMDMCLCRRYLPLECIKVVNGPNKRDERTSITQQQQQQHQAASMPPHAAH